MNTYDRIPSREEAESILAAALEKNPGKWGAHSRNAAVSAEAIGRAAGLDPDRCYVSGLLHDIGRFKGQVQLAHIYHGWKYMEECGYPLIGRVCLTHSFAMQKLTAYGGAFDLTEGQVEGMQSEFESIVYDDYDRLIQLCDSLAVDYGFVILEKRFVDVTRRYGIMEDYIRGWEAAFAIKEAFEKEMGCSVYDVLPDIGRTTLLTPKPWKPGNK
jgi:hypothetical protein